MKYQSLFTKHSFRNITYPLDGLLTIFLVVIMVIKLNLEQRVQYSTYPFKDMKMNDLLCKNTFYRS